MYASSSSYYYFSHIATHFSSQDCSLHRLHPRSLPVSALTRQETVITKLKLTVLKSDTTKEKIRKLFDDVELSCSSYDTAWVAMVPSQNSPNSPCFPQCLKWLIENQLNDGSWGLLHDHNPSLLKDRLSSTLASVIALKRWNIGEDQINKGLRFIESNFAFASDENQHSPIGFDIIFPGMLEYANNLNLKVPLQQKDLRMMLHQRELELKRCHSQERNAYLAYISEGLGNFINREMVLKYQMKNGSILNSPSATAAAFVHHQNSGYYNYLNTLLNKFGNAVPTIYPGDIYARLCMVDTIQDLGIGHHFRVEIQNVLDETYRRWVEGDEQIFMDVVTCALAFRVLRTNGYEVSSDHLVEITNRGDFMNSCKEPFKDVYSALEVYKASEIMNQEELAFEEQKLRSKDFLERKISNASISHLKFIHKEVDNILRLPIDRRLERISTRRNIDNYNVDNTRTLKTTFRSSNISNKDYLRLAVEDFNACQSIYREELEGLEKWVVDNKLNELTFARQRTPYSYFSGVLTFPSPEQSEARIAFTKSTIMTAAIDDFFDVGASMDEMFNFVKCIEKWDVDADKDCCSEIVRILFFALKDAVTWIADKAFKRQDRNITTHVVKCWLDLAKSMLQEAIWVEDSSVPTMSEYIENGRVSFALAPIVFSSIYFAGPKLSEEIVYSSEAENLFRFMGTHGRLMNDIISYKRELEAGKLNAVTLIMHENKEILEEEAVKEVKAMVDDQSKKLMDLVMQVKGSVVPRECKEVFWITSKLGNFFYASDDGFSGSDLLNIVNQIIYEPVSM